MQLKLNRYNLKITRLYTYKIYEGLLCAIIDSKRNNAEETEAKEALEKFNTYEYNILYFPPYRTQNKFVQTMFKEDFIDGFCDKTNYPEEKIDILGNVRI